MAYVVRIESGVRVWNLETMEDEGELMNADEAWGAAGGMSNKNFNGWLCPQVLWDKYFFAMAADGKVGIWNVETRHKVAGFNLKLADKNPRDVVFSDAAVNCRVLVTLSGWKVSVYPHAGHPETLQGRDAPAQILSENPEVWTRSLYLTYLSGHDLQMNKEFAVTCVYFPAVDGKDSAASVYVRKMVVDRLQVTPKTVEPPSQGEPESIKISADKNVLAVLYLVDQTYFVRIMQLDTMCVLRDLERSVSMFSPMLFPVQFLPSADEILLLLRELPSNRPANSEVVSRLSVYSVLSNEKVVLAEPELPGMKNEVVAASRFRVVVVAGQGDDDGDVISRFDYWD
jgi:hypothetical protein